MLENFNVIGNDWDGVLTNLFKSQNFVSIKSFLQAEYLSHNVYPKPCDIFNAFKLTAYCSVKAVILGQDPYHGKNQAHGLCFSVNEKIKLPPSLVNIYKELKNDVGIDNGNYGTLTNWAKQGVLLLNTSLTVREGLPNSHSNCGWTAFTDNVIRLLSNRTEPVVFILWGANARAKKQLIDCKRHFVIESAHPSPLSCHNGFFNSKPFSKTNKILSSINKTPIDWRI